MPYLASRALLCAAVVSLPFAKPSSPLVAQAPQSTVHGRVLDPTGLGVGGATVELLSSRDHSRVIATAPTAADGSYRLPVEATPATGLELRASAPGFRTTVSPLQSASIRTALDLTLGTPTRSEEITVTATGTPTPLAQSGAAITVLTREADYPHSPEIQQPLRLVPGVEMAQSGQAGSASSLFLRGAESNATKVLIDGVPVNDIGGATNFASIASVGLEQVEVLRQPNSALYGSDALAGVVSMTTSRGTTPLPLLNYSQDGGNLGLLEESADLSGAVRHLDYFTAFARLDTRNNLPNNAFHNVTFAGNYGYAPDAATDLRLTFRHTAASSGQPNAFDFFGIPDLSQFKEQNTLLSAVAQRQTTARWHNLIRYGHEQLHAQTHSFGPNGTPYSAFGYFNGYIGKQVTIVGANGYSVAGQAILDYSPGTSTFYSTANRDFAYAQTDYRLTPHLVALGAFKYEAERGSNLYDTGFGTAPSTIDRRNQSYTVQLSGDALSRFFYVVGSGIERNDVFGTALTPRVSLAYYAVRPDPARRLSGTKLHASFGKGIKGPSVGQQNGSLYQTLVNQNRPDLIARYNTRPLGAEYSRGYDAGVEQQLGNGRARINATFFHNEYTNGIQYISQAALLQLGLNTANATQFQYGAYANALAFRSLGAELETEFRILPRVFLRGGYTYLDARVQRSFSSDALSPSFNTSFNFASTPIGAYAPLVGARPFRRAPHTGYFALSYAGPRLTTILSGTLVGRRDDSTFLSDKDFGNSLLLPNRNLDPGYQRLELTAEYRVNRHIGTYADLQNLLNQHYAEVLGYPALPFTVRGGFRFRFGGESLRLR